MPVTVDHFVLSNGDTAKYDYDGLNNKPNFDSYLKLVGGTVIADNADLNSATYVTPGIYTCPTTTKAATLTNCPTQYPFIMIVRSDTGVFDSNGASNSVSREIYGQYSTRIWRQNASSDANGVYTFTDWFRFDGSPRTALTTVAQDAGATGWTITHIAHDCRAGACWIKFEASFSGSGINEWVDVATGFPRTDRVWFWQCVDENGKRYKLRVTADGALSVKNINTSSTLYVDTTISYPIIDV